MMRMNHKLFGNPEQVVNPLRHSVALYVLLALMALNVGALRAADLGFSGGDAWLAEEEEFLKVDEAFVLSASLNPNGVLVAHWDMPDGYYLYRHQFSFSSSDPSVATLGEAVIPPGKQKVDEFFGEVEVYYHSADIAIPVKFAEGAQFPVDFGINYQGCADLGLCYPPETRFFTYDGTTLVSKGEGARSFSGVASAGQASLVEEAANNGANIALTGNEGAEGGAGDVNSDQATGAAGVADTEEEFLAGILASENLLYALGLFFLAGIGLAFTPCVLPMVPILSSIIVGEGEGISKRRAFTLSLAYVLGMAATYAFVGMLVGLFGAELNLQASLQSPGVLIFFALVFVVLSLSMFGFYELQLPQALQDKLNNLGQKQQGGKHLSVLFMGALSSLVVSPCVSAPLAGALIYISTTNDALLGGSALLALGLGMGVPLLIVGGSGGHWLPRAGNWMNGVKAVFGVLLLGVAIWLLERVVPAAVTLALWAALLLASGVYLGVLDSSARSGFAQFGKSIGAVAFVWGILLLIGAASGASDPLKPLAKFTGGGGGTGTSSHQEANWVAVKSLADVQAQIAASSEPVILDLYADWCISCKTMERNVFPRADVAAGLAQFKLLRADVTKNDAIDRELLQHYGLFGPPSLVFFKGGVAGGELREVRIQGEIGADALAAHLSAVLKLES